MTKPTFLIALTASAAFVSASFELAYVADNFDNGLSLARIHRFDPSSGVYLGVFGENSFAYRDIAVSRQNNRLYAIDQATLHEFDLGTGIEIRAVQYIGYSTVNVSADGNSVLLQSGSTVRTLAASSLTTTSNITLASAGATVSSIELIGSDIYALETISAGAPNRFIGRYTSAGVRTQGTTGQVTNSISKLGKAVTNFGYPNQLLFGSNTTTDSIASAYVFAGGSLGVFGNYTPGVIYDVTDTASLHVGGVVIGQNAANLAQGALGVTQGNGSYTRLLGTSILKNPIAVTTVVAPEPASMLALAVGAGALLRRRARR